MKRNSRPRTGLKLVYAFTISILLIALLRQILFQLLPTVRPSVATLPVTTRGEALLTGQALVLVAPVDGQPERLVAEGARVAKGTPLLRLSRDARSESWLAEREETIKQRQRLEAEILSAVEQIVAEAVGDYTSAVSNMRKQFAAGQVPSQQLVQRVSTSFANWVSQKAELVDNIQKVERLDARIQQLDIWLQQGAPVLRAPVAGTVTYTMDGLESIITPERFLEMLPSTFERWLNAAAEPKTLVTNGPVSAGAPVAVIRDSWQGWVAVPVPQKALDEGWLTVGSTATWKLAGRPVKVRVHRIAYQQDYEPVAVAEITNDLPYFLTRRRAPFEITWGQITGHLLPSKAVAKHSTGHRVAIIDAAGLSWQPVNVLWQQDDQVLVAGLAGHEKILAYAFLGRWINWELGQDRDDGGGQ